MKNEKQKIWKTWRLDAAKKMPPLKHTIPGESFDITKSEVVKWLVSQPDIMQLIFNAAKGGNFIAYNPETGTWIGVDYET